MLVRNMLNYIIFGSLGLLLVSIVILCAFHIRLVRIVYAVRRNTVVDIKPTAEQIEYLTEQRDSHHWSHPKYKAYNDRLRQLGVA